MPPLPPVLGDRLPRLGPAYYRTGGDGQDICEDVELVFGLATRVGQALEHSGEGTKEAIFRRFLPLGNGIPSPDTFERVFAKLAPGAFAQAFGRWMAAACETTGLIPIAIDGKSARRAKRNTATGCLTVVSAWATESRLTLGQVAVPDGSNEIGAIPELLRTLELGGAIVTIDAAGCQTENARLIREQGGHYLLAVKDNQPTLRAAVERVVEVACNADLVGMEGAEAVDDAHGRHEERYVGVFKNPEGIPADWPDVAAVIQVNREREVGGKRTCTSHYYLTSYAGTASEMGVMHYKEANPGPTGVTSALFLDLLALQARMIAAFPTSTSQEVYDSIMVDHAKEALTITPLSPRFNFYGEERAEFEANKKRYAMKSEQPH